MKNKRFIFLTPILGVIFLSPSLGGVMAAAKRADDVFERTKSALGEFCVSSPKGDYHFSYPELNFYREKGEIKFYLCQAESQVERIALDNSQSPLEATVEFGKNGFVYYPEQTGLVCEKEKLLKDIKTALENPILDEGKIRFEKVSAVFEKSPVKVTEKELRKRTKRLAIFTTYFSTGDEGRCRNIALAADKIDGVCVKAGERFSFNKVVGERTRKNGFQEAKIIQSGEFVKGVGGGVCQVSTTLYNAVLLSGLRVTAFSPHSLAVSYVAPSRDAMVSSQTDFCFENNFSYPIYLSAKVNGGGLTVGVYGKPSGKEYKIVSKIVKTTPPPAPEEKAGDEEGVLRSEKEGVLSEAYLETYEKGVLIAKKRLRVDEYAPVRGVVVKKVVKATKKMR